MALTPFTRHVPRVFSLSPCLTNLHIPIFKEPEIIIQSSSETRHRSHVLCMLAQVLPRHFNTTDSLLVTSCYLIYVAFILRCNLCCPLETLVLMLLRRVDLLAIMSRVFLQSVISTIISMTMLFNTYRTWHVIDDPSYEIKTQAHTVTCFLVNATLPLAAQDIQFGVCVMKRIQLCSDFNQGFNHARKRVAFHSLHVTVIRDVISCLHSVVCWDMNATKKQVTYTQCRS